MRLGIRRKLIGTLVLVGLFPLALSLVVILGGGAAQRLSTIRNDYESMAVTTANQIAVRVTLELERLSLLADLPEVIAAARERSEHPAPTPPQDDWAKLKETDPAIQGILHNVVADRLSLAAREDPDLRRIVAVDTSGRVIAADAKPRVPAANASPRFPWFEAVMEGRPYVSTVMDQVDTGRPVIHVAVPVLEQKDGGRRIVGALAETLDLAALQMSLAREGMGATGQLVDVNQRRTVFPEPLPGEPDPAAAILAQMKRPRNVLSTFSAPLEGAAFVPLQKELETHFPDAVHPSWLVVVSRPTGEALTPVYHLAAIVALIGIALILLLFIVGVLISNREIIQPVLLLRQATAAVGRGELNVRVSSEDAAHADGRVDELGDLARDFDDMTRQLQRNMSQLARSNEAKRRFMELAGHELRTPITYILGVCQLAQRQLQTRAAAERRDDPARDDSLNLRTAGAINGALGKIAAKTQRLSRIIENLLKLVGNDQFTTRLTKAPVDMRDLILQVAAEHRPFVAERKQHLELDVPEQLPQFEGDRDKLEDVLTNLVSNAIRFSPDGATIKLAARRVVGDMLEILVEDAGPGIPEKDLAELFEPFYTGSDILHHHSGTIEYGSKGLGLGLAIVRRFVEIHGGVVRAHNTGHGTQFQVLLPLTAVKDLSPPELVSAGPPAG